MELPAVDGREIKEADEEEESRHVTPPCAYAIPGNHDWYDGLHTFVHCICHRDWLGGWRMPQRKSYFALRLPHDWWIFGLDYALNDDIDPLQYQYFLRIIENEVGSTTSGCLELNTKVILCACPRRWASMIE